ncbi:hypothetical protein MtrunA17_Chr5g0420621 [Medicago truncatula]|uniref:Transmembrane protein n=1 Tax=Medicago truncatula TaxID=3880 RepID=A0A396HWB0_MEDTR|nr:hypothetical protein MtrunA17_Chr5g0420621 [Medicago truncatula]
MVLHLMVLDRDSCLLMVHYISMFLILHFVSNFVLVNYLQFFNFSVYRL